MAMIVPTVRDSRNAKSDRLIGGPSGPKLNHLASADAANENIGFKDQKKPEKDKKG